MVRLLRFFTKIRARSRRCSSFSANGHAPLACSVASALAAAHCRCQPFAGRNVPPIEGNIDFNRLVQITTPILIQRWRYENPLKSRGFR